MYMYQFDLVQLRTNSNNVPLNSFHDQSTEYEMVLRISRKITNTPIKSASLPYAPTRTPYGICAGTQLMFFYPLFADRVQRGECDSGWKHRAAKYSKRYCRAEALCTHGRSQDLILVSLFQWSLWVPFREYRNHAWNQTWRCLCCSLAARDATMST